MRVSFTFSFTCEHEDLFTGFEREKKSRSRGQTWRDGSLRFALLLGHDRDSPATYCLMIGRRRSVDDGQAVWNLDPDHCAHYSALAGGL
jgi:hypothetical protein